MTLSIDNALDEMPIIAILRGVSPNKVLQIANALIDKSIRVIEVPLNSPDPYSSIRLLTTELAGQAICGAGTVTTADEAHNAIDAGAKIVVSPNTNPDVIRYSVENGAIPMPGFATPTEAFIAIQSGARFLKLFPADTYGPAHVKALKAVLPGDVRIIAVGGVSENSFSEWRNAGVYGFGIGSNLYSRGATVEETVERATKLTNALKQ